ncbi:effector-associated constant component EACC1 [Allorhizocola rhizosphaerae]|uniref:effector-associated constant component EACC1 n=1 Tax=Allorhizocola rhizosphaerae TaxID=1872709 RepID=UPI0013C34CBC|nr:hypothetical protein [Allorhizocola rhizosphaerae]
MRIAVSCPDELALQDLYRWLRADADVMRAGDVTARARHTGGTMGALEVVDIVLTHAIALSSVLVAYASWRTARPKAPTITFKNDKGITVTATDASPETIETIIEALGDN